MEIVIKGGKPKSTTTRYAKGTNGETMSKGVKIASCGDAPLRGALLDEIKGKAVKRIRKDQKEAAKKAQQAAMIQAMSMPPQGNPAMAGAAPRPNPPGMVPQMRKPR